MRRLAMLVPIMVGLATGVGYVLAMNYLDDAAAADDTRSVTVHAYKSAVRDVDEGSECYPWGFVDSTLVEQPFRQLLVTDAHGIVVGVMDLQIGTYQYLKDDELSCVVSGDVTIGGSSFYTFAIDGKYRRTIATDSIDSELWAYVLD